MNVDAYRQMHSSQPGYGAGLRHYEYIKLIIQHCRFKTALDYGCGKGRMANSLNASGLVVCSKYDPAIESISAKPTDKFDFIINTDVLEHIPKEFLDEVIGDFKCYSDTAVVIPHLGRATAVLPTGENAHCTILTPDEWSQILKRHYRFVQHYQHDSPNHALFVCSDHDLTNPQLAEAIRVQSRAIKSRKRSSGFQRRQSSRNNISGHGHFVADSLTEGPPSSNGRFNAGAALRWFRTQLDRLLLRMSGPRKRTPPRIVKREPLPPASDVSKFIYSFIQQGQLPEASFLLATIPGCKEEPFFQRAADLPTHFTALEREFRGGIRLIHFHACVIVSIRRCKDLDSAVNCFNSLWDQHGALLRELLSLRWLISAADTFADYGSSPVRQSLALTGALFGNTIKLVESERYIEKHDLHETEPLQPTKGAMLFDGMSVFRVRKGDMLANMNARIEKICGLDAVTGPLLLEIIKRVRRGPTTFYRLRQLRKRLHKSNITLNI
jgi:hypothetical protein